MNVFQFIMSNKDKLGEMFENLIDGEITIPPDEFDFAHPDVAFLKLEAEEEHVLMFVIDVSEDLYIRTVIEPKDFGKYSNYIKTIKNPRIRIDVVECLEDIFRINATEKIAKAEAELNLASDILDEAVDKRSVIDDLTIRVKKEWGIK